MSPDWIALSINMVVLIAIIFASEHFIEKKDRTIALLERACEGYSVRLSAALEKVESGIDREINLVKFAADREKMLKDQRDELAAAYLRANPFVNPTKFMIELNRKLDEIKFGEIEIDEEEKSYG